MDSDIRCNLKMKIGLMCKHLMLGSNFITQLHEQHYQLHLLLNRLYFCHMCGKILIEINRGLYVDDLLKIIVWFGVTIMVISVCFSWAV